MSGGQADQLSASTRATGSAGLARRDEQPRVLFVINSLAGGGAERMFATLIAHSESCRARFDIQVALLDQETAAYSLPQWVPVTTLDARGSLLRSIVGLTRLARVFRPQVICTFLTRSNIAGVVAARATGAAAVISERVNTTAHLASSRLGTVSKALVRLVYPRASRVLAVSQGVADTLADDFGVKRQRLDVVHNPVDVATIGAAAGKAPPIEVRQDDVVVVGRLMPNKNFALAIRAFAQLSGARRLLVLGSGPLRGELQALTAQLGVADRVVFTGFVDNPHAILARAGVFVLSSNAEGFPNAMVEAMAAGIPVVATDCRSGPAEILELDSPPAPGTWAAGSGGLLVPVNDLEAMVAAIREASRPECRSELIARAERRLAQFSIDRFTAGVWRPIEAAVQQAAAR